MNGNTNTLLPTMPHCMKYRRIIIITCVALLLVSKTGLAQKITKVKGTIVDANTKLPLPFVNVTFLGTNIGTTTDFDGKYALESKWASDQLIASFVGYETDTFSVALGTSQTTDILLKEASVSLASFTVSEEKERYKNKGNPAVKLIKKVIQNKAQNNNEQLNYYEYDKYEKIEFDINNITEKFKQRKIFKKLQYIFNFVNTSEINGKPYLPVFLRETASKVYYRKQPKDLKEYKSGIKITGFEDYLDDDGISYLMDMLYQEVDIYENNINLLSNQFTSPLSNLATTVYKYFIIDTLMVNNYECINVAFLPRSKSDFAFKGNLYIRNDTSYAVTKVQMGITDEINLNFVADMQVDQEFSLVSDSVWMLSNNKLVIDYNPLGPNNMGVFGSKHITYSNTNINLQRPDSIYDRPEKVIELENINDQDEAFWNGARTDSLTEDEKGVYLMIDSVQNIPAFKNTMDILSFLLTGYKQFGPVEFGPIGAFYSFNDVEGFRLRFGGRTTPKFHKKIRLDGYLAYGFLDETLKYSGGLLYSFNNDFLSNPRHQLGVSYSHETVFPGQNLQFVDDDNFFLSFRRGLSNRMLFVDDFKLTYLKENNLGFSYQLMLSNKKQKPLGSLIFQTGDAIPQLINEVNTDEVGVRLRYAPNEQFYQGKNYRTPLRNKYPILTLEYIRGIEGITNGDLNYTRTSFGIFKRFYLNLLGFTDVEAEVGKIWGSVPFVLLHLPQANQSLFLQESSFNMMNFLEFLNDEHISVKATQNFNGSLFNKIPLLKKLKLREIVTFKMLYGRLTDNNNPELNPDLFRFPVDENGNPLSFSLQDKPYIEASVGVSNIFKILRIDLLQRTTYLNNPNIVSLFGVKGLSLRARMKLDF